MKRTFGLLCLLLLSVTLAGCPAKKATVKPPASSSDTVTSQGAATGAVSGTDAGQGQPLGSGAGSQGSGLKTTIYFDYDSSEIRPEFADTIVQHGKRLAADRSLKVRLEGNTDERGSAEYNVALGERRAQAVKRALLLQGASEGQLATVSYGEERPVAAGHDEQSWAQNRRVEIVTLGGR
jgi:peptidoglycan-associated lipoprotein